MEMGDAHSTPMNRSMPPPNFALQASSPVANDMEGEVEGEGLVFDSENESTPAGPEAAPNAPAQVDMGLQDAEGPAVTFATVNSTTSPAGMPNRIPPRVTTNVAMTVTGWHPPMNFITVEVESASPDNGELTIGGGATQQVTGSSILNLVGTTQTKPGHAGNLRLVAKLGSTVLGRSNTFSVSAIPQNWSISRNGPITGSSRGVRVNNAWESDSGNLADLDEAERSEKVEYAGTGIFAAVTSGNNSGYKPANNSPLVDSHGIGTAALTGIGTLEAKQAFVLKDKRTGATDIPAKNSGFLITRDVTRDAASGNLSITTTKAGAGVTSRGFTVTAGSGTVSETQAV